MATSVLVPTLNAARYLPKLIPALKEQSSPPDEIIVVDSSSNDETADIAERLGCRVEVIARHQFNHGATRNLAAELSRGETLVYMTQDALPAHPTFLETLTGALTDNDGVAAAYARQLPYPGSNPAEVFARRFNYPEASVTRTIADVATLGVRAYFFSNVASAVRREQFEQVGRFPTRTIANEDMLLCAKLLRAGHKVAYVAQAQVYHSHEYTLKQQFRRFFDIGVALEHAGPLLEGGTVGGQGLRYLVQQTRFLAEQGEWEWLVRGCAEAGVKYCALNMGKNERYIPKPLKQKLSMHSFFWQENQALDRAA